MLWSVLCRMCRLQHWWGGLFELLRSGGSHTFLRRLWNQFRATIPVESTYAQATWSKTESLVIVSQTLYPRVLRRVQSLCKDSVFSVLFREKGNGVNCIVRCQVDGRVREVCLLWEPYGTGICDAEIRCLSRVLSILAEGQSPVALFGCSSTLFNVFSEWCRSHGRSSPLSLLEYSTSAFKDHVREAGMVGAHCLDPFAVLEFLLLRLDKTVSPVCSTPGYSFCFFGCRTGRACRSLGGRLTLLQRKW